MRSELKSQEKAVDQDLFKDKNLKEWSFIFRLQQQKHLKLLSCLSSLKQKLVLRLARVESLLIQIDRNMYTERINLCNLLQYIGDGID